MQTEASLERDTDSILGYVDALGRSAGRPFPFAKLASLSKLGLLRRRLATAISRNPSPELEQAEAAAAATVSSTRSRRFAASTWGSRALMALVLFGGPQAILAILWVLSSAYTNVVTRPASTQTGYLPPLTRFAVVFLILFVFAYYFATPFFSVLLLWGGRLLRSWKKTLPITVLLLLAASTATFFTFKGIQNPYFAADSVHQFIESRNASTYEAYEKWLDLNWLLKDPKFKTDYEQYLRNGPGRWLMNRFDTADPGAWADPKSLVHIGEFVDQQHDQNKFREWLRDYVERNRINSRGIDQDIDTLVGPANQRFLSVWQAEPYLRDRDVNARLHYFSEVHQRVRLRGLAYIGGVLLVFLLAYLVGPLLTLAGVLCRAAKLTALAGRVERLRARYYAFPEADELLAISPGDSSYNMLSRVHRSYVRNVLVVTVVVLGGWAIWLASRSDTARPVATQSALMGRFVAIPGGERPLGSGVSVGAGSAPGTVTGAALPVAAAGGPAGFSGGTGDPSLAVDSNGDGIPDERPANSTEARLAEIQKQIDDSDYEFRKKFKATAALLDVYKKEIDTLKAQNARLEQESSSLMSTTGGLTSRLASAEGQARSASVTAADAQAYARDLGSNVETLAASVDDHVRAFTQKDAALDKRADDLQSSTDMIAADLDTSSRDLQARTERLGERATDLAERSEQIAGLQRTMYSALIGEFERQVDALDQKASSRFYRMFNKKDGRAAAADLRRRIQNVRALLATSTDPDAQSIMNQLVALQDRLTPIAARFE